MRKYDISSPSIMKKNVNLFLSKRIARIKKKQKRQGCERKKSLEIHLNSKKYDIKSYIITLILKSMRY